MNRIRLYFTKNVYLTPHWFVQSNGILRFWFLGLYLIIYDFKKDKSRSFYRDDLTDKLVPVSEKGLYIFNCKIM